MLKQIFSRTAKSLIIGITSLLIGAGNVTAAEPTELRIVAFLSVGTENSWDGTLVESFNRVMASKPHGLNITLKTVERVWGDDAETSMRLFASSGKYDIIYGHTAYSDQVKNIKDQFPDVLFAYSGSGNYAQGGNVYYAMHHMHEASYLIGLIAGLMTKSNIIGSVGNFPAADNNDQMNAFIAGAKSVNPNVKAKVTFIEAWYDPAKASEAANAQIAAGADHIFQLAEAFEVCVQKKVVCYANYADYNHLAPEALAASTLMYWDPIIRYLVDEWWEYKANGKAYNGPMEPVVFSMAEGSQDISPYHNWEDKIPEDVKTKVKETRQAILDGSFSVKLNKEKPVSD